LAEGATALPGGEYTYLPPQGELEEARAAAEACGVKAIAMALDVRSHESIDALARAAEQALGPIGILVNAAGVSAIQTVVGHPDETWHDLLDVNLNGPYRTIKRCLPGMLERRRGRIVNIASTAATIGAPGFAAYCAAKSGLLGLTRCVALEGAEAGVSCNAVSPGYIETKLSHTGSALTIARTGADKTVAQLRAEIAAANPQRRFFAPAEIGALVAFLCRDDAFGITGENITLSGGSLW